MLGTIGWRASLAFVRHIYKVCAAHRTACFRNTLLSTPRDDVHVWDGHGVNGVCRPSNANDQMRAVGAGTLASIEVY